MALLFYQGELLDICEETIFCFLFKFSLRNNFYFLNDAQKSGNYVQSITQCAELCSDSRQCLSGWRYQLASKLCIFMKNVTNITSLNQDMASFRNDQTWGWASGLKSCFNSGTYSRISQKRR